MPKDTVTPHLLVLVSALLCFLFFFFFVSSELQSELSKHLAQIQDVRSRNEQFVYIRAAEKWIQVYKGSLQRENSANIFRMFL